MSDLELDRAKRQASVEEVLSLSKITAEVAKKMYRPPKTADLLEWFLRKNNVEEVLVPGDFPVEHADPLRQKGITVTFKTDPFWEERLCKTEEEIAKITKSLRYTQEAMDTAVHVLEASAIAGNRLMYKGRPLSSERLRRLIHVKLTENDMAGEHTTVACGKDAVDPHYEGAGLLRPHRPIVLDIYPRSTQSRYYADITRTFVKGKASQKVKRMFEAVRHAQEIAFARIRDGADGAKIHNTLLAYFENQGFKTGLAGGRMQGFFHGTGHGVGLEIHEPPRISKERHILKAGEVVTVEPGLYYLDAGGVRLEDMVVVRKDGMQNLTKYPKFLEVQ